MVIKSLRKDGYTNILHPLKVATDCPPGKNGCIFSFPTLLTVIASFLHNKFLYKVHS